MPGKRTLRRMGQTMVDLYCASFRQMPRLIALDVKRHGRSPCTARMQMRLFKAALRRMPGFQPIVVFDGNGASFVTAVLRPANLGRVAARSAPSCAASCTSSAPIDPRQVEILAAG